MLDFLNELSNKIASDPNLQQSLLQLGGAAGKPYDIRQNTAFTATADAIKGSMEYLQGLRDADTKRQLAERQQKVQEGTLEVAQRNADTAKQKANTEEYGMHEGEVPYKQAYAEYLRRKGLAETLRLQMEKASKTSFDKNLWEAANQLTGDPLSFNSPEEHRKALLKSYNMLANQYRLPVVPIPLEYIKDEEITSRVNNPETEALFVKYYGPAGVNRLNAIKANQTKLQQDQAARVSKSGAPTTPATADEYALPDTGFGAGAVGRLLPSNSGTRAAKAREVAADQTLQMIQTSGIKPPPTSKDEVSNNRYRAYADELISRLKSGRDSTESAAKKAAYESAIRQIQLTVKGNGR